MTRAALVLAMVIMLLGIALTNLLGHVLATVGSLVVLALIARRRDPRCLRYFVPAEVLVIAAIWVGGNVGVVLDVVGLVAVVIAVWIVLRRPPPATA